MLLYSEVILLVQGIGFLENDTIFSTTDPLEQRCFLLMKNCGQNNSYYRRMDPWTRSVSVIDVNEFNQEHEINLILNAGSSGY